MNALLIAAKRLRDYCAETSGDYIHRDALKALFAGLRETEREGTSHTLQQEQTRNPTGNTTGDDPIKARPQVAYNYQEAAQALSLSVRTMKQLVADQRIEYCRIGTSIRFTPVQLQDYLARNTVKRLQRTRK